jgi:hypothetical protein
MMPIPPLTAWCPGFALKVLFAHKVGRLPKKSAAA